MSQKIKTNVEIEGDLEVTGTLTNAGSPVGESSPVEVETNADKLALEDIDAGAMCVITEEGNRLEQYIGGDISKNSNWKVLSNTIFLSFYNYTNEPHVVAGVTVPAPEGEYDIGWLDAGLMLFVDLAYGGSPTVEFYDEATSSYREVAYTLDMSSSDSTLIDLGWFPDRAIVKMVY